MSPRQNHKFFTIIIGLIALLFLNGCTVQDGCIDADDFGFVKFTVSSRYNSSLLKGPKTAQIAPWVDSKAILNGRPLTIMVKNWEYGDDDNSSGQLSAWCPWFGKETDAHNLSRFCNRLRACTFYEDNTCGTGRYIPVTNPPCLMKKGIGLYALMTKPTYNPNDTLAHMMLPDNNQSINLHVGKKRTGYDLFDFSWHGNMDTAGGWVYNYDDDPNLPQTDAKQAYAAGRLYFKIFDTYYEDNNGQYRVFIKSGVSNDKEDIITWISRIIRERLFGDPHANNEDDRYGIVRLIYQKVITNPGFVYAIRGALSLYVLVAGFTFLLGMWQISVKELFTRSLKISVVAILIDPVTSWDMFNEYLFMWFYTGVDFIIDILKEAAATGSGSDNILSFMTSEEIFLKVFSTLFASWTGFIYIIIYLATLAFLVYVIFNATIIYLSALVITGILITMAPLFIAAYLFETTKSLFDNWLKLLIGNAVQMIMISASVLFMSMIIRNQIYNSLGYRICRHDWPQMPGLVDVINLTSGVVSDVTGVNIPQVTSLFSWWFPDVRGWDAPMANIPVPKDYFKRDSFSDNDLGEWSKGGLGTYCDAYECIDYRYPDLPYLDPKNPAEARQIRKFRNGQFADFYGIAIVIMCIFLLNNLNKAVIGIAKFISGTSNTRTDLGATAAPMRGYAGAVGNYLDQKSGFAGLRNRVGGAIKSTAARPFKAISNYAAHKYENHVEHKLKKDALKGKRGEVVKRAEELMGMEKGESKGLVKAREAHKANLVKSLLADGSTKNPHHADKLADILLHEHPDKQKDSIAKVLNGGHKVGYNNLLDAEKSQIDRVLANEHYKKEVVPMNHKIANYQQAYSMAYSQMTQEGKGFLEKRTLPKYIANKVKKYGDHQREKEQMAAHHQQDALDKERNTVGERLFRALPEGIRESKFAVHSNEHKLSSIERHEQQENTLRHEGVRRHINQLTSETGHDIRNPAYMAKLRAKSPAIAAANEGMIREEISAKVNMTLDPHALGKAYLKHHASDEERDEMHKAMHAAHHNLVASDEYLKNANLFEGNKAAMAEVAKRKEMYDHAFKERMGRLGQPVKDSTHSDSSHGTRHGEHHATPQHHATHAPASHSSSSESHRVRQEKELAHKMADLMDKEWKLNREREKLEAQLKALKPSKVKEIAKLEADIAQKKKEKKQIWDARDELTEGQLKLRAEERAKAAAANPKPLSRDEQMAALHKGLAEEQVRIEQRKKYIEANQQRLDQKQKFLEEEKKLQQQILGEQRLMQQQQKHFAQQQTHLEEKNKVLQKTIDMQQNIAAQQEAFQKQILAQQEATRKQYIASLPSLTKEQALSYGKAGFKLDEGQERQMQNLVNQSVASQMNSPQVAMAIRNSPYPDNERNYQEKLARVQAEEQVKFHSYAKYMEAHPEDRPAPAAPKPAPTPEAAPAPVAPQEPGVYHIDPTTGNTVFTSEKTLKANQEAMEKAQARYEAAREEMRKQKEAEKAMREEVAKEHQAEREKRMEEYKTKLRKAMTPSKDPKKPQE